MRSQDEIQKAHDLLHAIFLGEIDVGQDEAIKEHAALTCTGLCFALGCPAGLLLADNLVAIMEAAEARGYRLHDAGRPMTRAEYDVQRANATG